MSVCPRPFSRLLLTRIQSRQAPCHLLPFLLLQGRPQVWKGREELTISPAEERGSGWGWGCCLWHPSDPIIQTLGWGFSSETEAPQPPASALVLLPPAPSPEKRSDTGMVPRDHIMRQTPVCPARQWELPLALTGTMTSDLKFLERQ